MEQVEYLGTKALKHLQLEQKWVSKKKAHDTLFHSLRNLRRDHAYIGRMFVLWTVENRQPAIKALFRVARFGINESGLHLILQVVRPGIEEMELITVRHDPLKVRDFDVYFWLPHFSEVRYVPVIYDDPDAHMRCSMPLIYKHHNRPDVSQTEGRQYFAPQSEYTALWPSHAF